jgi:hypothetical protein
MSPRFRANLLLHAWPFLAGLASAPAWALGIGEWHAQSYLGERAAAEAEIFSDPGEIIDANCFRLQYPGKDAEFPALENAKLQVRSTPKGLRLRIETSASNNEPIAQIRLKFTCGPAQTRDMLLFFSPREFENATRSANVVPSVAGAPGSQAAGDNKGAKNKGAGTSADIGSSSAKAKNKSTGGKNRTHGAGLANASAPRTASRVPDSSRSSDTTKPRLVLSGELDPAILERLRLSTELRAVPRQATEAEREQLRRIFKSMMQLADLKESTATAQAKATSTPATDAASTPASVTPAPEPTATPPAASTPVPPSKPAARAEEPKATPLPPLDSLQSWWLPIVGIVALALLLGLLLWGLRRRRLKRALPEPIEPMPSIHQSRIKSEGETGTDASETLDSLVKKEVPSGDKPEAGPSAFANVHGVTVHSESPAFLTSYRTMLDLADSMMAFGLVTDAADALKEYVDDHPDVAVEPWLKLLDILRHNGKRADFDLYSQKLRQHFNLDLPAWDAPDSMPAGSANAESGAEPPADDLEARFRAAPSPLEAFPHVRDRLVSMWGKAECSSFLQHLMRDNRAGKRRGFPLIVIDDILLLLDITQDLTGVVTETGLSGDSEIFSDTW